MTLDVEARLQRAARVLDHHLDAPQLGPTYVAPAARPSRRTPLVASVVAFAAVLAVVAAMVVTSESTTYRTITPGQTVPAGQEGWITLPEAPISPRSQGLVVSTGDGLFVWGGHDDDTKTDGAFLDLVTGVWRKLPGDPLAGDRGDAVGVWTGHEIVVLNGSDVVRAAAFDPVTFEWRRLPDPPLAQAANAMNRAFVVDGAVIVIGVATEGPDTKGVQRARSQGARLDLASSMWTSIAASPREFGSFFGGTAAGEEIIVVGTPVNGGKECGSIVLAYRPATDTWREIPAGPVATRMDSAVVWTGVELFVGGGVGCAPLGERLATGALLDPATNAWRAAPDAPMPFIGSHRYGELWTGTSVATMGRDGTPVLFDPARNEWHLGVPSVNGDVSSDTPFVWVHGSIVVWSGDRGENRGCCRPIEGGEAYIPPPGW
jgi:hypothetical protein